MIISHFPGGGVLSQDETMVPDLSYTGQYSIVSDGDLGWRIKFLSSGTMTLKSARTVDIFSVGGGGNGSDATGDWNGAKSGGGGGGGYTNTQKGHYLVPGIYIVTVGAACGESSFANEEGGILCSAAGGESGSGSNGGAGGSGGGSGSYANWALGNPGSDGTSGTNSAGGTSLGTGGSGQGTTIREFGEDTGDLYAGGGGGGGTHEDYSADYKTGGDGGGGDGASAKKALQATAGEANSGGGGGGGCNQSGYTAGAAGGTGIVIIRNAREVA